MNCSIYGGDKLVKYAMNIKKATVKQTAFHDM